MVEAAEGSLDLEAGKVVVVLDLEAGMVVREMSLQTVGGRGWPN